MRNFLGWVDVKPEQSIDKKYLVLSLHDVCIGPMFKALLRHELLTRDRPQRMIVVSSAGVIMTLRRRQPPTLAVHCLNKIARGLGNSISCDRARWYAQAKMSEVDVVICLESEVVNIARMEATKPGVRIVCVNAERGGIRSPMHHRPQDDTFDEYSRTISFMRDFIRKEIIAEKPV